MHWGMMLKENNQLLGGVMKQRHSHHLKIDNITIKKNSMCFMLLTSQHFEVKMIFLNVQY